MLSPITKRNILRIIPFVVIWLIFGINYSLIEKGLLDDLNYYPATGNPSDFGGNTFVFLIFIAITGYTAQWYQQKKRENPRYTWSKKKIAVFEEHEAKKYDLDSIEDFWEMEKW